MEQECIHHFRIPSPQEAIDGWLEGKCRKCGLVRRFTTRLAEDKWEDGIQICSHRWTIENRVDGALIVCRRCGLVERGA